MNNTNSRMPIANYYSNFIIRAKYNRKKYEEKLDKLCSELKAQKEQVEKYKEHLNQDFSFNLDSFIEYTSNKYINGEFLRKAKSLFINKKGHYELISDLLDVYNYANKQYEIYTTEKELEKQIKFINIPFKEYNAFVKRYYLEVQKKLLDGLGYVFEDKLGCIFINRYKVVNKHNSIDFAATREKKKKLLEEGKSLYDAKSAKWAAQHGIEYNAEEYRIPLGIEYAYEIACINDRFPCAPSVDFVCADNYPTKYRCYSYDQFVKFCNNDIDKITSSGFDVLKKVQMILKVNPTAYTKFIRNENQQKYKYAKTHR